jgi:hypothetical protein
MTTDPNKFWTVLRGAEHYCHKLAEDMQAVHGRQKKFHHKVDQSIYFIMENFTDQEVVNCMHTWLKIYGLPIDPDRLASFDDFHAKYGAGLTFKDPSSLLKNIKPY